MPFGTENECKILKNYKRIVSELKLDEILDTLISDGVLSLDDEESINSKVTQKKKNREFVRLLLKGPSKGYQIFIDALKEDESYADLAQQIETTEVPEEIEKPKTIDVKEMDEQNKAILGAALSGDVKEVKAALQKGKSVNSTDANGWTPIHLAAVGSDTTAIPQLLLEAHAAVNATTNKMAAALLRGEELTKKRSVNTVTIRWKKGSFLGLGGNMSQRYTVYDYRLPKGDMLPVYIQDGYESAERLVVDSKFQFGMNNGVFFLVYHNKDLKPYQHRFIQNEKQKVAYLANTALKAYTGGAVDLAWAVGDYLRDF